jgi:hypothetical protein
MSVGREFIVLGLGKFQIYFREVEPLSFGTRWRREVATGTILWKGHDNLNEGKAVVEAERNRAPPSIQPTSRKNSVSE